MEVSSLSDLDWKPYSEMTTFYNRSLNIFKLEVDIYYDKIKHCYSTVLSALECIKAESFLKEEDKKRYIVSRYGVRLIISIFTFNSPELIEFHSLANKKPSAEGIEFNISHSKNIILVAVSNLPVGIDIEIINQDFDYHPLVKACFSNEEQFIIRSPQTFYQMWTRKEALLKATGEGLVNEIRAVHCMNSTISRKGNHYDIKTISMGQYIFSVASITHNQQINFWNFC